MNSRIFFVLACLVFVSIILKASSITFTNNFTRLDMTGCSGKLNCTIHCGAVSQCSTKTCTFTAKKVSSCDGDCENALSLKWNDTCTFSCGSTCVFNCDGCILTGNKQWKCFGNCQ
ncbi:hypothetical protein C2G38_2067289 [Gigaspora rosea]|uniref:Uncharacterized protein n=1 Tax=Gigaspora rosea TaxID=44941 RepID=A0A397VSH8_9GLOM|nr:hypothetical protein C2G38_2067289 [Gigaspora rosea]